MMVTINGHSKYNKSLRINMVLNAEMQQYKLCFCFV